MVSTRGQMSNHAADTGQRNIFTKVPWVHTYNIANSVTIIARDEYEVGASDCCLPVGQRGNATRVLLVFTLVCATAGAMDA